MSKQKWIIFILEIIVGSIFFILWLILFLLGIFGDRSEISPQAESFMITFESLVFGYFIHSGLYRKKKDDSKNEIKNKKKDTDKK